MQEEKVQVITDDLEYNAKFQDYLKARALVQKGTSYRTVAVIGCQSSGKSTLLNLLFDTGFDVMDKKGGRQQTTKGIWMSSTVDADPTLIFDIEGTDSKERGEQRMTFEQTTSLFALAISDVLLINMWTTDIGRYGASNYGLLKVIFEVNLKLFGQQSAKKLLFVLRDFIEEENDYEAIKSIIDTDVKKIWSEMYKPEEYKDSNPEDFFQFEFCLMPHKLLQKEKFTDKAKELRGRFSVGQENSLFPETGAKNVPLDGLSFFIERTWDDIKNQKELNLPDQREMVANFRCNEVKDEALALTLEEDQKLKSQSDKELIADFKDRCNKILRLAVSHYDEGANHYETKVYKKFQKELTEQIMQNLYKCFDQQLKFISEDSMQKFSKETQKLDSMQLEQIVGQLDRLLKHIRNECLDKKFKACTQALIIEGSGWDEFVSSYENQLRHSIDNQIKNLKEKHLDKLERHACKEQERLIKDALHDELNKLPESPADVVDKTYNTEIGNFNDQIKDVLVNGFRLPEQLCFEFLQKAEKNIHSCSEDEIRNIFKGINGALTQDFNDKFKKDADGKLRDWRKIEEDHIKELYEEYKKGILELIDRFGEIKLAIGVTQREVLKGVKNETTETGNDDEETNFEAEDTLDFVDFAIRKDKAVTMIITQQKVITEDILNQVRQKFSRDADMMYEEALLKHRNIAQGGVPVYIWVAMAWFASDNILGWFSSPILFYPLTLILIMLGAAYQMGLMPIFTQIWAPVIKVRSNEILAKTPIPFRFD